MMTVHYRRILTVLLLMFVGSFSSRQCQCQVTESFTEPIESRLLAAAQPDVVGKLHIKEGSKVQAGEALAELDNAVLKQSLRIATLRAGSDSEIRSANAALSISKNKYEKLLPMLEKGHANPAEVEKAKVEYEQADAELKLAQEKRRENELEVERIKAEIETRIVRSPFDGVVTQIHFRPGEFIASNERQLVTIVKLDELRVRFYLFTQTAETLAAGQRVNLLLGSKQQPIDGVIEFVSPVTDPDSDTTRVDVVIDNRMFQYRSGVRCVWQGVAPVEPVNTEHKEGGASE